MGCHLLLQGISRIQGWNPHLLHWQVDSLQLSLQGSPTCVYRGGICRSSFEQLSQLGTITVPPCTFLPLSQVWIQSSSSSHPGVKLLQCGYNYRLKERFEGKKKNNKARQTNKIFKPQQPSTPKVLLTRPSPLWGPLVSPQLLPCASFPAGAFSYLFTAQSPPKHCSLNCISLE